MRKPLRVPVWVALATAALSLLRAQNVTTARAGAITLVEGVSFVNQAPLKLAALQAHLLKTGERVRTAQGKVEMAMGPNIVLWLGDASALKLTDSRPSDAAALLESGSAIVEVTAKIEGVRLSVSVGATVTVLTQPGVYRFDAGTTGDPQLRVYGGQAEVHQGREHATVKSERAIHLTAGFRQEKFDRKKDSDQLHVWSSQRSASRDVPGKNWRISSRGTLISDAFGTEVRDAPILRRRQGIPDTPDQRRAREERERPYKELIRAQEEQHKQDIQARVQEEEARRKKQEQPPPAQ